MHDLGAEPRIDAFASATAMMAALRSRDISARELLYLHSERIQRYNSALNAIVALNADEAISSADRADSERARGRDAAILGLPLTVKDAIDVVGMPTTSGVRRRRDERPERDAPIVARVREAGGVIVGKTNTPPYAGDWQTANSLFGRTNNPWNPELTPGGSTGGGAAAVAAGLSPLELGSDIGGSIRVPAAFCGIYGHRPSETAVPRSGHFPGSALPNRAAALNVLGPLARDAADLELALDVICGPESGEAVAWRLEIPPARRDRLADFRVAVLPWLPWQPVDTAIVSALEGLVTDLQQVGTTVAYVQPEGLGDLRDFHRLYTAFLATMFSFNMGQSEEARREEAGRILALHDEDQADRALGLLANAHDFLRFHQERERYRETFRLLFRDWDVLLAPAAIVSAFPHDDSPWEARTLQIAGRSFSHSRLSVYAGIATLPGQPATAFPMGQSADEMPIGLQVIGPYLEDRTPIRFAGLIAQAFGGYRRPPGFE